MEESAMRRARPKRYLGMTLLQWGILAILGLCACGTLAGGYWWLNAQVASAYIAPAVTAAQITPLPTFTPTPTETPSPTPSPTPIVYESLIPPGWKQFTASAAPGLEIWLPPSYVPQTEKEKKEAIQIAETENENVAVLLELKDSTPSPYLIFTSFELATRRIFAADLDEMINADFGAYMRRGRLLERDAFQFVTVSYPARRLIFDINANGASVGLVIYVVQVGGDLYYLGFATPFNETYPRLPDFDRAAQTFRVASP